MSYKIPVAVHSPNEPLVWKNNSLGLVGDELAENGVDDLLDAVSV